MTPVQTLASRALARASFRTREARKHSARAVHEHADDRLPAAAGAPARLHARVEREARARAARPGVGRRRARRGRPRRRRHVPRPGSARRLSDRVARGVAGGPARRRRVRAPARRRARSRCCADFGIAARPRPTGYTGVWVGDEKIAAIGVRVSRGRTRHGFALNVDPDLSMFEHIVPCGIRDRGVTSMARLLGRPVDDAEVVDRVVARFAEAFGCDASSVKTSPGTGRRCGARRGARLPVGRWRRRAVAPTPQAARVDARAGPVRRRLPRAEAARARASTCTRSARRRAARTSTSAGPIAPPRS